MARSLLFWISLATGVMPVLGSDFAREQRLTEEVRDILFDGEIVMLDADDRQFLSIFTEAEESQKAVIIIHGRGFHADWADTVQPLRVGLVDYGWNTLSLQMPVLAKDAKYYDYVPIFDEAVPRIESAIAHLQSLGQKQIVLIAHSCGVHMSMHYLRKKSDDGLTAYVGIGMGATDYKQKMAEPFPLKNLTIPVLDIYGALDFPAVHRLAPGRLAQMREAGHMLSSQQIVDDADHYFTGQDDALLAAVAEWLGKLALPDND